MFIRELVGVPLMYSEFVYCEFSMVGVESTLVLPRMDRSLFFNSPKIRGVY